MYASPLCKYSAFGLIQKLVQRALLILCKMRALKNSQISFMVPSLNHVSPFGTLLKLMAAMASDGLASGG